MALAESTTPIWGIRYPTAQTTLDQLPTALAHMAADLESTLSTALASWILRTNYANDPEAVTIVSGVPTAGKIVWSSNKWFGASGQGTHTLVTGDATLAALIGISTKIRKTWTVASTSTGDSGFQHSAGGTAGFAVTPGTTLQPSAYLRVNTTGKTAAMFVQFYDSAGAAIGGNNRVGTKFTLAANTWTRVGGSYLVPPGAAFAAIASTIEADSTNWAVGNYLDGSGLLVEVGGLPLDSFFDGATADTSTIAYRWNGTANAAPSVMRHKIQP